MAARPELRSDTTRPRYPQLEFDRSAPQLRAWTSILAPMIAAAPAARATAIPVRHAAPARRIRAEPLFHPCPTSASRTSVRPSPSHTSIDASRPRRRRPNRAPPGHHRIRTSRVQALDSKPLPRWRAAWIQHELQIGTVAESLRDEYVQDKSPRSIPGRSARTKVVHRGSCDARPRCA